MQLDHSSEANIGLTLSLDRPYHELKEHVLTILEQAYLTRCLEDAKMNISRASRVSGLSRKHIRTLMAKHGLREPAARGSSPAIAIAPAAADEQP